MSPQFQVPRLNRRIAQVLIGIVLTILLLLISSGPARTDDSAVEAVAAPSCKPNVPNTAITAVYCAYGGSAKFGATLSEVEDWNGIQQRRFQFGTIYYVAQSRAAFALFNHVRDYYNSHPSLGKPITSEIGSQDKGFCKAFFTGTQMIECQGINNPQPVAWTPVTVHLPRLEMPFDVSKKGKYNGGPHAWGSSPTSQSAPAGSGLDIGIVGSVTTMASGTVIEVSSNNGTAIPTDCSIFDTGLGCWVAIRNDFSGTVIVYGHLQPNEKAKVGDWLVAGTEIGNIKDCSGSGCIGRSEGPHVHLELRDGRSSGNAEEVLWGGPLSWHGVAIGEYLISGGFKSVSAADELGSAFDYDGTAFTYEEPVIDVHRLYTQPELARLLEQDDFEFGKFKFDDNGTSQEMYAWMTQAAWDECKEKYDPDDAGNDLLCETLRNSGGTVFAYGDLGATSTARAAEEVEAILESSNVARSYDPLFSPPDDPSAPPTCTPTADQVAIYDDANYGTGKPCKLLDVGTHDSLGSLDNATSSIRVGANVKVTLYSDLNRGGDNETFTADDPDLANNERIQRNEASSALVQSKDGGGGSCQPSDYQVALFDDVYFNPNKPCRLLATGDYSSLGDLDNVVSSVRVGSKVTLVLFENTGYGGSNETFYHDDYNLDDNDYIQKNEASSAKVMSRAVGGYSYCNANRSPGETEVVLFDNPRYGSGACAILKVGDYRDLSSISFENEASSIRVGSKVKVMVCTKKNYDESEQSGGECETYSSDVPDLDATGEVPRNSISSAKVELKLLCHPLADGVILYENSNYGGGCATLTAGTWNLGDFRYNDIVSSLRFVGSYASGWSARLCQDANLGGTCSIFTGGDSSLSGDAVGNDRASSIAIAPLPPASAPSLTEIANPEGLATYQVNWTAVVGATWYELEEQRNGATWTNVYMGEATSTIAVGKDESVWCYRARAANAGGSGPWSGTNVCTTVAPPIADPDLKVDAITFGNPSPTVGQSITIEVEIRNVGEGTAGPSTCTLYWGDPAVGGIQIADADCGTLSPNANSVVAYTWIPGQAGQGVLFAVADSGSALSEADETNNRASVEVTVQPPPVLAPTITGFTPDSGPTDTVVAINGTNLTSATAVTFNGTPATFAIVSATRLDATVPAGATTGKIAVTTPGGTALSENDFFVEPGGCSPGANGIVLYEYPNYSGRCITVTDDEASLASVAFDNLASSIRFVGNHANAGWQVSLFSDVGFAGGFTNLRFDDPDLANNPPVGNDQASSIRLWQDPDDEQSLTLGASIRGTVSVPSDQDSYRFSGTAGQVVTITLDRRSGDLDPYLILYGPKWGLLAQDDNAGGNGNALIYEFVLWTTGTYHITAQSSAGATSGTYRIEVRGPTCSPAPNGVVLYEGVRYTGRCITLTADNPHLSLYAFDDTVSSVRFAGSYAGGAYQVTLFQGADYTGWGTNLRFNDPDLSDNAVGDNEVSAFRIWADSDDGRTIGIGEQLPGTVHIASDGDMHLFNGVAGQTVSIWMTRLSGSLNPYLVLYDPYWNIVVQDDNSGGNLNARIQSYTLGATGTYRIQARSFKYFTTGDYVLGVGQ